MIVPCNNLPRQVTEPVRPVTNWLKRISVMIDVVTDTACCSGNNNKPADDSWSDIVTYENNDYYMV